MGERKGAKEGRTRREEMVGLPNKRREEGERRKEARPIIREKDSVKESERSEWSRQCFKLSCFFTESG